MRAAFAVAAFLAMGAGPPTGHQVSDEVATRKLVLVDAHGKVRATLSAGEDPKDTVLLAMGLPNGD